MFRRGCRINVPQGGWMMRNERTNERTVFKNLKITGIVGVIWIEMPIFAEINKPK